MYKIVVGIDEVGRGPWAGPVVSSAVALDTEQSIDGVNDSKKLSKQKRESIANIIKQSALGIGIGWSSSSEVDALGLSVAVGLSMQRAMNQVVCKYDEIVIDGNLDYLKNSISRAEIRADQNYVCVSAASIIAKVARDNYMTQVAKLYPKYGFERHVGYGTKLHQQSLKEHGVLPLHRASFSPIASLLRIQALEGA